jgi:hypothetical protein
MYILAAIVFLMAAFGAGLGPITLFPLGFAFLAAGKATE